ncbi:hypothetical protein, partial [Lonsdalea quercina]|uniref:hypothetical protein n=1 Tax=Lonsdalea quercina TaxID=71657 RepID=UPI0039753902
SPCESRELPGIKPVETLSESWGFLHWGEKKRTHQQPAGPAATPSPPPASLEATGRSRGHVPRPLATAVAMCVHRPAYPLSLTVLSYLYYSVSP